jgi:nitroreductase
VIESRQVLRAAAEAAQIAPSIHNTQPWRFVVATDRLELWADRRRWLPLVDPEGHMLLLSCGTALHHVGVALSAAGWGFGVERTGAGHLANEPIAVVRLTGRQDQSASAARLFQATLVRQTDRRVVTTDPVPPAAVMAVRAAVTAHGAGLHVVPADQRARLAAAVQQAQHIESDDPARRAELAHWVGGRRLDGTGVPDSVLPAWPPPTTVPERDFGHLGALDAGHGPDTAAVYAILFGANDEPVDWLRAGEALDAAWLEAIQQGLALLPYSAPTEVLAARETMRGLLAGVGYPYIVLRLGRPDPDLAGPPLTPRLAAAETIREIR